MGAAVSVSSNSITQKLTQVIQNSIQNNTNITCSNYMETNNITTGRQENDLTIAADGNSTISGNTINQTNENQQVANLTVKLNLIMKHTQQDVQDNQTIQDIINQVQSDTSSTVENAIAAVGVSKNSQYVDQYIKSINTSISNYVSNLANEVKDLTEQDISQLNRLLITTTNGGSVINNIVNQTNKNVQQTDKDLQSDLQAATDYFVQQMNDSGQSSSALTDSTTTSKSSSNFIQSLIIGIVIIVVVLVIGVVLMLYFMLKNPEGVKAIGDAATNVTKASQGMPIKGGHQPTTQGGKTNPKSPQAITLKKVQKALMVCFIILLILTAVFFGIWIYKKYISIVNPLAWIGGIVDAIQGEDPLKKREKQIKIYKILMIVAACLSGASLISGIGCGIAFRSKLKQEIQTVQNAQIQMK